MDMSAMNNSDRFLSDRLIEYARVVATHSPCAKSKRGCIVVDSDTRAFTVYGSGFNGPPPPFSCDGSESCRSSCRHVCIHAEARAIIAATSSAGNRTVPLSLTCRLKALSGLAMVHIKVDAAGVAVPSGPPSCEQCSKLVLDSGLDGIWLWVEADDWRFYPAKEFHDLTLKHCGLHPFSTTETPP